MSDQKTEQYKKLWAVKMFNYSFKNKWSTCVQGLRKDKNSYKTIDGISVNGSTLKASAMAQWHCRIDHRIETNLNALRKIFKPAKDTDVTKQLNY